MTMMGILMRRVICIGPRPDCRWRVMVLEMTGSSTMTPLETSSSRLVNILYIIVIVNMIFMDILRVIEITEKLSIMSLLR